MWNAENQKKFQNNQARKIFPRKLSKICRIPKIFGISGIYRNSREIFWKFPVYRVVKNPTKQETVRLAVSKTFCRSANGLVRAVESQARTRYQN